jgi:hypothetical protein
VRGIERLLAAWGLPARVVADTDSISAAADRCVRAWGGGLPMLAGLRRDEIRALLAETVPVDPLLADPLLADPLLADPLLADPVLADPAPA